jgi:hypothetical protein
MINNLYHSRNTDFIVATGIIKDKNWNIRSTEYEKAIYVFDSKQLIGIDGIYYYNENDTNSYIITTTDNGVYPSDIFEFVKNSGLSTYLKNGFYSKSHKIININEILSRAGEYNHKFNIDATDRSITFFKNIAPLTNIGAKVNYTDIANDINIISDVIKDCYGSLIEYKKVPYSHELLSDDDIVRLLNLNDIIELNELYNLKLEEKDYNEIDKLSKLLDQYTYLLSTNKELFKQLNKSSKTICNFIFYVESTYIKMKYKNLIKCRPSKYYYRSNPFNLVYRILKLNNKYDKFVSELKAILVKTI